VKVKLPRNIDQLHNREEWESKFPLTPRFFSFHSTYQIPQLFEDRNYMAYVVEIFMSDFNENLRFGIRRTQFFYYFDNIKLCVSVSLCLESMTFVILITLLLLLLLLIIIIK
jgi:hypothetical protein